MCMCVTLFSPYICRVFLVTKLLFALDIFVTYLLQFYVPLDFLEPLILKVLPSNRITYWSKMAVILPSRTVIVLLTGVCVCVCVRACVCVCVRACVCACVCVSHYDLSPPPRTCSNPGTDST